MNTIQQDDKVSKAEAAMAEAARAGPPLNWHVRFAPAPRAHQCAAGAGARHVADAMRASSRPAWGTRHE